MLFRFRHTVAPMLACLALTGFLPSLARAQPATTGTPEVRQLIVRLKPAPTGTVPRESAQALRERLAAAAQGANLAAESSRPLGRNHQVLRLRQGLRGDALTQAIARLQRQADVLSVEPDVRIRRQAVPNDPDFAFAQFHLQAPGAGLRGAVNMPAAWDIATGAPVTVAVLDTGVRPNHPELQGRLLPGYDFVAEVDPANDGDGRDADPTDPGDWVTAAEALTPLYQGCLAENSSWHGTFIAGQLAALTNNGVGVAGLNWNGRVLPVRISGKCGAMLSDILDGIRWAAGLPVDGVPNNPHPARLINLSFGGDQPCTASYQDVIDEITAAGALLVVAAGNQSGPALRPADCAGVLAVGAVGAGGSKTSYSNVGPNLGLSAPGGTSTRPLFSLVNDGFTSPTTEGYGERAGTSFSAPLAAGVASLMLSVNPALTPAQLVARLRAGSRPFPVDPQLPNCSAFFAGLCNCTTSTCGAGLLDGALALQQALNPVAAIAPPGGGQPGDQVTLDGRASAAANGQTLVAFTWTQLSGPTAALRNTDQAVASATLPAAAGTLVFRLQVSDSTGRSAEQTVVVENGSGGTTPPATDPGVGSGTGGGSGGGSGGGGGAWSGAWGVGLWAVALAAAWHRAAGRRTRLRAFLGLLARFGRFP